MCININEGRILLNSVQLLDSSDPHSISLSYLAACDTDALEEYPLPSIATSSSAPDETRTATAKTPENLLTLLSTRLIKPALPIPPSLSSTSFSFTDTPPSLIDKSIPPSAINLATTKKYKPVALKVKPVIGALPGEFRIVRTIKGDPLTNLPILNPKPPPYAPCGRYTQERKELFDQMNPGFLLPEE
ncbi:hypothetical protein BYT27DRAFT_7115443, partial [Phlegmacium glaucopus]